MDDKLDTMTVLFLFFPSSSASVTAVTTAGFLHVNVLGGFLIVISEIAHFHLALICFDLTCD